VGLDPAHQVVGHRLGDAVPAHHHGHARARVGQVHDRLPGGVAGAHHDDVVAAALPGLAAPRSVVHAAPEQLLHAVDFQAAPVHPRRRDQRPGAHRVVVRQLEAEAPVGVHVVPRDAVEQQQLGPEPLGLPTREARELGAADPAGEAEEVLDQRRVGSLAARHVALDDERREPVGRRVDRGREPGGARADDGQVVLRPLRRVGEPPGTRDPLDGGRRDDGALVDEDRKLGIERPRPGERLLCRGAPHLQPVEGLCGAGEEVAQAVVLRRQPAPDDGDRGASRAHGRTIAFTLAGSSRPARRAASVSSSPKRPVTIASRSTRPAAASAIAAG
jgi:hypothetical protein